ncbi:MAG: tripartite tricarboxylate transporter substrate binding protein [Reyranella sp.]|uniref:Bug family tripartite tricarboxylate transporter substrate binding protein n=1 Tax=Reyranella sp. TaxID=1929291 RepID=UPI001AC10B7C|nr:tripartite tricarboxylate transporter substrate binding protein [Reyranella sp.]MBN9085990.1 tripartite tricarboxylate transporter substrate binding protein [Reyranella sp.]
MSKMMRRTALAGLVAAPFVARADSYPSKAIRMVVPFAPGGTTDLLGRIAAEHLQNAWGANVVVENKSGAGGNIGADAVAKAAPDGYTLLLGTVGTAVTNQFLYKKMPYDTATAFAPVALFGEVANVLAVHKGVPVNTAKEYVEYCKKQGPGKVSFGSPAIGGTGHLAMEYFQSLAGFKVEHIVYRGSSLVLQDLLAGNIPSTMDNLPPYLPHINTGALKALGVSSSKRWFALPDVPTIAEQGFDGFDAAPWWYVAAPAGTPRGIVAKLSAELVKGGKLEATIKKIRDAGASDLIGTDVELTEHIKKETVKWKKVVEAAGLQPQ